MGSLIEFEKDNFKFTVVFGECCVIRCTTQNIQNLNTEQYQMSYDENTIRDKYFTSFANLKQLFENVKNKKIAFDANFDVTNDTWCVLLVLKFKEPYECDIKFTLSFLNNLSNENHIKILKLEATVEKLNDKIDGLTSTINMMLSKINGLEANARDLMISTNKIGIRTAKMQKNNCREKISDKDLFNG